MIIAVSLTQTRAQHGQRLELSPFGVLIPDANEDDGLRQELWMLDDNGFSFLHYICMYGYTSLLPVVLDCIKRGANGVASLSSAVNKSTKSGVYPLHLAASAGSVEMVQYLMCIMFLSGHMLG